MEERLMNHLAECLAAVEAGESVETCLRRYPDEASELSPLLHIAVTLRDLPQPGPSAATSRAAKASFLAEAAQRRAAVKPGHARLGLAYAGATAPTLGSSGLDGPCTNAGDCRLNPRRRAPHRGWGDQRCQR